MKKIKKSMFTLIELIISLFCLGATFMIIILLILFTVLAIGSCHKIMDKKPNNSIEQVQENPMTSTVFHNTSEN